jgi:hypothetical protein
VPFAVGLVVGFGIGFAGALFLAPEQQRRNGWPPTGAGEGSENSNGFVSAVRGRLNEAMAEAREARKRAEQDMIARYERKVGRKTTP